MRDSFWFLPTVYSLIALVTVTLTILMDTWLVPNMDGSALSELFVEKSTAASLYSALITSVLTMTTISFSTIMVVLTTYSTQFSPRTLQDFMKSRVTQHVLGVFSFGFLFTLINLLLLGTSNQKEFLGAYFTVTTAVICLGFFILFIHHSSRFLQVNNLIGQIRNDTSVLIDNTYREKDYKEATEWNEEEVKEWQKNSWDVVKANQSGYLQGIEIEGLLRFAKSHDILLSSVYQVGDFVQKGAPAFYYWQRSQTDEADDMSGCLNYILVGNERTNVQDIEFSIQKLVEIAVKSISPSINDPHTAVNSINRIGSLLSDLASVHKPYRYYADQNEDLRFMMEPKKFRDYLYKGLYQIRLYGKKDMTVMDSLLEALYKIAITSEEHVKEDTWQFAKYIMESTDTDELHQLDFERFYETCNKIANVCGEVPPIKHA
ncbi:DUF2254 domain-containing protein [Halalkalibacillus sediminis]|nr:DUF2254 domain-containing protein [Halalkalibacillus sediminis]